MNGPTIRGIKEEALSAEDHAALDILRHLPIERLNQLKDLMDLGDPGIIGPQTLAAFRRLSHEHGFDLSPVGVNAFKDAHQLGNIGDLRGVIGEQTAGVYFDELMKQVSGSQETSVAKTIFAVTGAFEGRGFTNLTGDFDKQGISFGFLQWNFGQGSLPPVLKRMHERDPEKFREIFGQDADRFLAILSADGATQLAFAREINNNQKQVMEPWKSRFIRLGEYPLFQDVQVEFGSHLLNNAKSLARTYGLETERGLALMFDVVVQNGSISGSTRAEILKAKAEREQALGRPLAEREFLEIVAVKVADAAKPEFHNDVLSRKMSIAKGVGKVHGRSFDLEGEFGLTDAKLA